MKVKNGVAIENKDFENNQIVMTTFDGQLISIARAMGSKLIQVKVIG